MDWKHEAIRLFTETELSLAEIRDAVGKNEGLVRRFLKRYFGARFEERKQRLYSQSKRGEKNPMQGKIGDQHHNWIGGVVGDGNGYLMEQKPVWYTGREGSKYVFQHTLVICAALNLSELPAGWVAHHIDENRINNVLSNLALMTQAAHARLHARGRCNDQSESS